MSKKKMNRALDTIHRLLVKLEKTEEELQQLRLSYMNATSDLSHEIYRVTVQRDELQGQLDDLLQEREEI